jgi:hypothetical protein
MGKSDLRVRFARRSLTDIIAPASPGRALQTLQDLNWRIFLQSWGCGLVV